MSTTASKSARIACVQYDQRRVASFEEFAQQVEYFTRVSADYQADFVVFPELFTLQLLSMAEEIIPADRAVQELTRHTPAFRDLLIRLAAAYHINIIGGTHLTEEADGRKVNTCFIALRDGTLHRQDKLHPTPSERRTWGIVGGDAAPVIKSDHGPIGVMICYDSEFPELSRYLVDQGAQILFVPFCTDERQGYLRVRYCCQARAVENQAYLALAGNVGNLPGVANMDIQYSESCILTPCDFPFARDGIANEVPAGVETVIMADLDLEKLGEARRRGTVTNLNDRRHDLYEVHWKGDASLSDAVA